MLLCQAAARDLKGFLFISDSPRCLATAQFMLPSPDFSLRSKSFVTGLQLYEQVSSSVFGCWFKSGGGYWWALPRVYQNSFKSCLLALTRCGVITSSSRAAPLLLSFLYQRGGGRKGRKNISIQRSFQSLSSTKSNSAMMPAKLKCTVSNVSVECLTQSVGFLMGLFSQRHTWQRLFLPLHLQWTCPKFRIFSRQQRGRVV